MFRFHSSCSSPAPHLLLQSDCTSLEADFLLVPDSRKSGGVCCCDIINSSSPSSSSYLHCSSSCSSFYSSCSTPHRPLPPGLALTFIQENSFSPESGSRPGVPRVVVLVTDGKSQDDVIPAARSLRESGVEVFAIGGYRPPPPQNLQTHLVHSSTLRVSCSLAPST